MKSRVLVLGATGRMGRAAVNAFQTAGWHVRAFARRAPDRLPAGVDLVMGDAFDSNAVAAAATGTGAEDAADVIINALNPPYERWADDLPRLTDSVIHAAREAGATVILPGNVYNYGADMPPVLTETTPHRPTTRKGRLREDLERSYRASGVPTIVLRAGDFIERKKTGNWFDTYIAHAIHKGVLTYPGPTDIAHAWAYLPDLAAAMVGLAERRASLAPFESIGFEGHTFSGETLRTLASVIVGRSIRMKSFPWTMLRLVALFNPTVREVLEMRYLWNVPHEIDGRRLRALLPDFRPTSLPDVLREVLNPPAQSSTRPFAELTTSMQSSKVPSSR